MSNNSFVVEKLKQTASGGIAIDKIVWIADGPVDATELARFNLTAESVLESRRFLPMSDVSRFSSLCLPSNQRLGDLVHYVAQKIVFKNPLRAERVFIRHNELLRCGLLSEDVEEGDDE